MATTVTSDVSYISKLLFADDAATQKAVVRDKPLLNATPQRTNFTSAEGIKIPALYATGQGASATVATSASNASPDLGKAFTLTQATYYTNVDISGKVLRNALKGNDDSYFLQQFKLAMENAMETMGVELARQEYGSANGMRAQSTTVAAGVITFSPASLVVYFEPGMKIVASAAAGGALRDSGAAGTVTAVDTSAGTVTYSGTITAVGNTDFWYRQGDAANGGSNLLMSGLADWVPATVTSTAFFGVDRTAYPSRLAGCRYNGASDPVETVLIKAMAAFQAEVGPGLKKGDIFLNPLDFGAFQTSKEGGRWITEESSYGIGIDKFQIGPFKLVPDSLCPTSVAYMINDGAFCRFSCGSAPYWNDFDGSDIWLDRSTDTVKAQLVHDGQFGAMHVNRMGRITLPAL